MDVGDIVFLKVVDTTDFGAFLSWPKEGERDILVPLREQFERMQFGLEYLVIICYDQQKEKYYASARISDHLKDSVEEGDRSIYKGLKLHGTVYAYTPLGVKVALNKKYTGLLYANEIFRDLELGTQIEVYVKTVREDGRIDLMLQNQGYKKVIGTSTSTILSKLKESGGFLPFNDQSSPESIYEEFNISKKKFKEAIGALFKQRKITITDDGIKLN